MLHMHGKYKNNKVWGGTIGSVGFKVSPKKFSIKEQLQLPPLSQKPIFGHEKIGKLSISESIIPSIGALK